jgi:hypothetical protein
VQPSFDVPVATLHDVVRLHHGLAVSILLLFLCCMKNGPLALAFMKFFHFDEAAQQG